ncbi:serine hydrolase [Carnobacterium funditum]|uniref:serine hydrolase n=1 Tax=Carnobacterium funditum TaxID=2752 RepID=UPI00055544F4|nr:serine hydrolase [Carnobacterium funditum]
MRKTMKFGLVTVITLMIGTFLPVSNLTSTVSAAAATPEIEAEAAFILEPSTGKILMNQNGDKKLGIASMTKMISEYLIFEALEKGDIKWDQAVPISDYAQQLSQDNSLSNVPLRQDETYTFKELYQAMAIYSANAATVAMAEAVAGSEPEFVDMMREKVESWGIKDYDLYNSTGLSNSDLMGHMYPGSNENSENAMSARSIALVAQKLLKSYPEVLETTSIPKMTFKEGTSDFIEMDNWNWMLKGLVSERENVDGLKTGTTDFAGATFTGTAEENGMRIITVVMNATDGQKDLQKRFVETDKMMDWAFSNWEKVQVYKKNDRLDEIKPLEVEKGKTDNLKVVAASDMSLLVPVNTDLKDKEVTFTAKKKALNESKKVEAPIKKGAKLGTAEILVKGDDLGYINGDSGEKVEVIASEEVEKANVFVLAGRWIKVFVSDLF